jgi:GNAT superfamily N-acetyltransferase
MFTDPKHQRRGVGTKLLKWGVERADEMGAEMFLEATQIGRHMYEQNGFQVTQHVIVQVPEKWAHKPMLQYVIMRRPPVEKVHLG